MIMLIHFRLVIGLVLSVTDVQKQVNLMINELEYLQKYYVLLYFTAINILLRIYFYKTFLKTDLSVKLNMSYQQEE